MSMYMHHTVVLIQTLALLHALILTHSYLPITHTYFHKHCVFVVLYVKEFAP